MSLPSPRPVNKEDLPLDNHDYVVNRVLDERWNPVDKTMEYQIEWKGFERKKFKEEFNEWFLRDILSETLEHLVDVNGEMVGKETPFSCSGAPMTRLMA